MNKKFKLTPKIVYLAGAIIGDGSLSDYTKSKKDLSPDYRIRIDISDKEYLFYLERLIKSIIETKTNFVMKVQVESLHWTEDSHDGFFHIIHGKYLANN